MGNALLALSKNGWMNTLWMNTWIGLKFLKLFTFDQRLLVWDRYECYIKESQIKISELKKIESLGVPGGCAKYAHAPDVSLNKNFKAKVVDEYEEWPSTVGIDQVTDLRNLTFFTMDFKGMGWIGSRN